MNHLYGAGGGATHVAFLSGQLYELENYKDKILIVSGGGGGGRWQTNYTEGHYGYGGHGGGFIGGNGTDNHGNYGSGGTQTGKTFGKGANNLAQAAGGGGFFGGTAGCSGGGGSGYIGNPLLKEKEMYCYKCQVSNEEATKTISTTCISSSPISNCAKQGHGYAKITYLGK